MPPAFPRTLSQITIRVHLRDGRTQTFVNILQSSCNYYIGAFLSGDFRNREGEDIRAHHLDFELFRKVLCSDFNITFPSDNIQLGYVYKYLQLPRNPKFIVIRDVFSFHNCISVLWNSSTISTSVLPTPLATDLHIFNPKLDASVILPALNLYLDVL